MFVQVQTNNGKKKKRTGWVTERGMERVREKKMAEQNPKNGKEEEEERWELKGRGKKTRMGN